MVLEIETTTLFFGSYLAILDFLCLPYYVQMAKLYYSEDMCKQGSVATSTLLHNNY